VCETLFKREVVVVFVLLGVLIKEEFESAFTFRVYVLEHQNGGET